MSGASFGSCSYAECPNSYSTDSNVTFFKFPIENARRKKWIDNCGNSEITQLSDRQLRGRRICSDHFEENAFANAKTMISLNGKAIPILYQPGKVRKVQPESDEAESETPVKKRGRPARKISGVGPSTVKQEPEPEGAAQEEAPKRKSQSKVVKPEVEEPTPVKRRPGRPPRKSSIAQIAKEVEKDENEKEESQESERKLTRRKQSVESSEVPDIAPILSGRQLRGKRLDSELPVVKESTVEVVPILDEPKRQRRSSATGSKAASSKDSTGENKTTAAEAEAPKKGPGRPGRKSISAPAATTVKEEPGCEGEKETVRARSTSGPGLSRNVVRKRKTNSGGPVTYSTKRIKEEKSGESCEENNVDDLKPSVPGRRRQQLGSGVEKAEEGIDTLISLVVDGKMDYAGFEKFHAAVKGKCNLSDRWSISGIMFDPVVKMKMIAISEMQISISGSIEIKRCVQVFEDLSVRILFDDINVTGKFDVEKIYGEVELVQLITKVSTAKVCPGVKNFSNHDATYHANALKRGNSWFSAHCPIIVDINYCGPLCVTCNKLRGALRRRKTKDRHDLEKRVARPEVKKIQSKFGRALYGMLNGLLEDEDGTKKGRGGKTKVKQENVEPSSSEIFIEMEDGTVIKEEVQTLYKPLTPGRKAGTRVSKKQSKTVNQLPKSSPTFMTPITSVSPHASMEGQFESGNNFTVIPQHMLDQFVGASGGNIIIQEGGEFTLADGQEYELIGESEATQQRQATFQQFGNETYEIVEVDDQTMAQFAAHNGGMFVQDSSNIQVTQIDPNDPNLQHFIKVLTPGEYYESVL